MEQGRIELPTVLAEYDPDDYFFNLDELALFFKLQPDRVVAVKGSKGHKRSKERVTIVLITNATGIAKLKPIIIGLIDIFMLLA